MGDYEDRFDIVVKGKGSHMSYIDTWAISNNQRLHLRNGNDLAKFFEKLNKDERNAGRKMRFSRRFIDGMKNTFGAQRFLPHTFGSKGGKLVGFGGGSDDGGEKRLSKKGDEFRRQGRDVYRHENGEAVKEVTKKDGKIIVRFRDVDTGDYVDNKDMKED